VTERQQWLDDLYGLLDLVEQHCGGKRELADCDGRSGWPRRGVYFFFERGETREDDTTPRVVRVGTHGLRPSKSTLWGRLRQHKGSSGGSMPGGGNHRGSIFRLHIGCTLLASDEWPLSIRDSWEVGQSATTSVRMSEYPLEQEVTRRIGEMPFLWLAVDDEPGPKSDRARIEAGAISLLSNLDRPPLDPPSPSWLGSRSPRRSIRESGLWNVDHVEREPDPGCLEVLARYS
jgi:hypothetical protein